jgi:hypothetical protein
MVIGEPPKLIQSVAPKRAEIGRLTADIAGRRSSGYPLPQAAGRFVRVADYPPEAIRLAAGSTASTDGAILRLDSDQANTPVAA